MIREDMGYKLCPIEVFPTMNPVMSAIELIKDGMKG